MSAAKALPKPLISDYGIIGNLHTTALVSRHGALDFLCFPRFDSPSLFARLLDEDRGGTWSLSLDESDTTTTQLYHPDTAILITRLLHRTGMAEVVDFMPPVDDQKHCQIVRVVHGLIGDSKLDVLLDPHYPYAERATPVEQRDGYYEIALDGEKLHAYFPEAVQLRDNLLGGSLTVREGEKHYFLLQSSACEPIPDDIDAFCESLYAYTEAYWRRWTSGISYTGEYRRAVLRSALTLKLLTSAEHGSSVAAPTFGLPESLGGERNWDYRYTWIRDSAFTMYSFLRLGLEEEARAFIAWIERRCAELKDASELKLMYRVDGETEVDERELSQFAGYRDSKPVRVGNGAQGQRQLDIYGELIDTVYLFDQYDQEITYEFWQHLTEIIDYVAATWREPDHGIWEVRDATDQFTMSKVMAWVALDRGIRIAQHRGFPAPLDAWTTERDALYRCIYTEHFDEATGAFTQAPGSGKMDGSLLMMPLVRFITPYEPKWKATLEVIEQRLVKDCFVKRFAEPGEAQGRDGTEGYFTICSFWYIEVLAKSNRVEEAENLFAKALSHANHLGLYSEEIALNGDQIGNFPQAFTHLALISAALQIHEQQASRHQSEGTVGGPRG